MRHNAQNKLIALLVSMALIVSVSCTTHKVRPIQSTLPQEKIRDIKIGDTVKITTYAGEQYKFKVEAISKEAIEGEGHIVPIAEIESIKKVRFTGQRILAAVGIIALLVLLVWLGSNSKSTGDGRYASGSSAK